MGDVFDGGEEQVRDVMMGEAIIDFWRGSWWVDVKQNLYVRDKQTAKGNKIC